MSTPPIDLAARRAAAVEATAPLAASLAQPEPIPAEFVITKPGVYDGIPSEVYHRDPVAGGSLSSSGAKRLVRPGGPARFREWLDSPEEERSADLDLGAAAHQLVLGDLEDRVHITDTDNDWNTKALKEEVAAARVDGLIPMKPKTWAKVCAMAAAIEHHPLASQILHPSTGKAEQTLVWRDKQTKIMCRARIDWLRNVVAGQRLIIPDYKTTAALADGGASEFGRTVVNYDYEIQAWFYSEAVRALGIDNDPVFVFIVQEKDPPYLVNVLQLPAEVVHIGMVYGRNAMQIYADCTRTGRWPGYSGKVEPIHVPGWWLKQHDEDPQFAEDFEAFEAVAL